MVNSQQQWQIPQGAEVRSADDEKLGKVVASEGGYIVVEKGFFFPTDYYIPVSAVSNVDGDNVYLSVTKDAALSSEWSTRPVDMGETAYAYDTTTTTGVSDATMAGSYDQTSTPAGTDTLRVPLHEEELTATTRQVDAGSVRIEKDVVTEQQAINVPVTEERVQVTRRAVNREGVADESAFTEGTIEVPVQREEVDVQKRVRVSEELDITKEAVQRTEQVSDTVRREVVDVDETSR